MKRIKVVTTYTNVDDEFLDWYADSVMPNPNFKPDFLQGEPVTMASKDPESEAVATTTWQVVEEFEQ